MHSSNIGLTLGPLPHLPYLFFPNDSTANGQSTPGELNYETRYVPHPDPQILFSKFLSVVEKVPPKAIFVTCIVSRDHLFGKHHFRRLPHMVYHNIRFKTN